nr:MAG TPA: BppU domain protein [Caudoviricetes sp.]
MDIKHQSLVLDINETRNYTFIKACQGDQKSRYIDCTLTQNGSVLRLTSNYRAIVKASINNEVKAINSCTIDTTSQVIVVELTSIMLDTPGILNCEITVQDGQQIFTSQAFAVQVRQSTVANETEIKKSKEYGALVDALSSIADVESKADRVQTLVDNIDKLKSADDIINRLSTSETNIEANKTSIKKLSELVQEVKNSAIAEIESLKADKLDKADFNAYKTNNDTAVKKNATNIAQNATNIAQLDKSKANLVQSYNLFDWSILNGKTANGLTATATDDGGYHITGTPTKKYVSMLVKSISLENGEYYITSGKTTNRQSNCYSQITLVDKDKKETYYSEKSFTVSNENLSEIILSVQTGTLLNYIDVVLHPCLCKAKYKDNMPLSYNIERSTLELANQLQPYICNTMSNSQIKVTTDKSTSIVLNDSSDCNIVGLTLYGKSTQSAIPTPTNPVAINSVENPSITFSNKKSSQNLQLNYILRGVDNTCDVLTINSDGTGFITEKLQQLVLLSSDFDNLKENPSGTNTHRCTLTLSNSTQWANSSVKYAPLCNVLQFFAFAGTEKYPCFDIRTNTLYVDLGLSLNDTKATLKNCADENNGIVLVGVKQTPTVINLTNEQINGFLNLHMYYPSTTVVSDCDSQLTYIADTKNYIDNKFNELATALVAHESEVM